MAKNKRPIPNLGHPIIETHCHLDYLQETETAAMLDQATDLGIERLISISVSPENLSPVRMLAERFEQVYATQGVHPHEAELYTEEVGEKIRSAWPHEKLLAVGEIGLDYYYDHADRKVQREVFASQLAIACDLGLPIVVHSREADKDTAAILSEYAPSMKHKGVIHSFTSSLALAETCLSLGFSLGFNGIITFNKAENVREVLAATPLDRILLETDSPYLTPVPYRGRENAPVYLPFIAEKVAEVKSVDLATLLPQVYQNSEQVFFSAS